MLDQRLVVQVFLFAAIIWAFDTQSLHKFLEKGSNLLNSSTILVFAERAVIDRLLQVSPAKGFLASCALQGFDEQIAAKLAFYDVRELAFVVQAFHSFERNY